MSSSEVRLRVNGRLRIVSLEPDRSLLVVLREELGLTGAKYGCGEGVCGACTVAVDGVAARSCVLPIGEVADRSVMTVEGLGSDDGTSLDPVQEAVLHAGALQCGYCTPGMILALRTALDGGAAPTVDNLRSALDGNVCRCGVYPRLLRAVASLASGPANRGSAGRVPGTAPSRDDLVGRHRPRAPWDLAELGERKYFEILGPGLVVVLGPQALERGRGRALWSVGGGAWLHVGEHGRVTAFTGKVDVGQDNRTALSLLIAEELCVPLDAVDLVMGDTDLCPYDVGTFGSRSTPDAGEVLRHAAAAGREQLLRLAADGWEANRADLVAEDGAVRTLDGARRSDYGQLLNGREVIEVASLDAPVTSPASWRTAGRGTPRASAIASVKGATTYTSDISLPGMLHGRVLHAPSAAARLVSADTSGVDSLVGVTLVRDRDFIGVVAPDPSAAAIGLAAIQATWDAPLEPSEAGLEAHLRSHPGRAEGWEGPFQHETGNVDAALATASSKRSATYTTAYIAHVPLETRAAVAEWDGDRVTIWTGTQRPFGVREDVAGALGLDEACVRVIVPATGGAFGGKHGSDVAREAAMLARAAGRPVKVRWTRAEEFESGYLRPASVIDVTSGVDATGRLTAWQFTNWNSGAAGITTPYEIPDQRIEYRPAESPLRQGAYRALAATANTFARESHMDELAHAVGADPVDYRLRHLADERLAAVLRAAADRADWTRPRPNGHGTGIACGTEKDGRVATFAEVSVGADRRLVVQRIVTAFECGAIVNPENLINQVEGAMVMGLGGALFETVHFEGGRVTNGSLRDYRVPRISDVPPIEVVLIDRPDLPSAGAGESPLIAIAPALANAIFAATGTRLRSLPLAPDAVV